MVSVHLKKLRKRVTLSAQEEQAIRNLVSETRKCRADEIVVRSGERLHVSMMLLDGWMARVKDLPSGERQVTELHVAGDFTDIHGFTLKCLDHGVVDHQLFLRLASQQLIDGKAGGFAENVPLRDVDGGEHASR